MVDRPRGAFMTVPPALQQTLAPLEVVGKQFLAWIGAALLIISLFLNSKTLTVNAVFGTHSTSGTFWDWAPFWGTIIFILALATAGLAYLRDYRWLLVTGALTLVILIFQFLYTFSTGVSYSGVSAHPPWYTWTLLFAGPLAILAAALMRPNPRDKPDDHGVERLIASLRGGAGPH